MLTYCTNLNFGATEESEHRFVYETLLYDFLKSLFFLKEGVSKELQRRECLSITAALLYKNLTPGINRQYELPVSGK